MSKKSSNFAADFNLANYRPMENDTNDTNDANDANDANDENDENDEIRKI